MKLQIAEDGTIVGPGERAATDNRKVKHFCVDSLRHSVRSKMTVTITPPPKPDAK